MFYSALQLVHGLYGVHVAEILAQYPHAVQGHFVLQQVVAAGAAGHNVDGGEDALVAEHAVQLQLHVSGSLELLEDDFVHLAAGVNQCGGDDGEASAVLNVTGGSEEALGLCSALASTPPLRIFPLAGDTVL